MDNEKVIFQCRETGSSLLSPGWVFQLIQSSGSEPPLVLRRPTTNQKPSPSSLTSSIPPPPKSAPTRVGSQLRLAGILKQYGVGAGRGSNEEVADTVPQVVKASLSPSGETGESQQQQSSSASSSPSSLSSWCNQRFAAQLSQNAIDKGAILERNERLRWVRRRTELTEEAAVMPLDAVETDTDCCCVSSLYHYQLQYGNDCSVSEYYVSRCELLGIAVQRTVLEVLRQLETQVDVPSDTAETPTPLPTPSLGSMFFGGSITTNSCTTVNGGICFDIKQIVLGPKGFLPLLDVLHALPRSLKILSLANCGLTDKCIECLCLTLQRRHRDLLSIDVSGNARITFAGGTALLELISSTEILYVNVEGTGVRAATVRKLAEMTSLKRAAVHNASTPTAQSGAQKKVALTPTVVSIKMPVRNARSPMPQ